MSSSETEQASIADVQYRTAFHFQPAKNWMNDPNGPMYFKGLYHLFYQYNPDGAEWSANIHWGHSVSTDLVSWSPVGLAFSPSKPFDAGGCWSGSATFLPGNRPVILYTGQDENGRQVQNVSFPADPADPLLEEWVKPDYNPVIDLPDGVGPMDFRDPSTGWLGEDEEWRVLVGSVIGKTGIVFLYKSADFVRWVKAEQPLYSDDGSGILECPDFFPASPKGMTGRHDGVIKHVLKLSIYDLTVDQYIIGSYLPEEDVYVPDGRHTFPPGKRLDYGRVYASKTFFDERLKRRVLWGWSDELNGIPNNVAKGWAGIQIIPREIWVDQNGEQLVQWPIREIETLRRKKVSIKDVELPAGAIISITGINSSQADVEVEFEIENLTSSNSNIEEFDPGWLDADPQKLCTEKGRASVPTTLGPFGLYVLASEQLDEYTAVCFSVFQAPGGEYVTLMCSDQSMSSLRTDVSKAAFGGLVNVEGGIEKTGKISLRTLIDHSAVESFGGEGRTCITSRVYPMSLLTGRTHLFCFNNGSQTIRVSNLNAWEMAKAEIS